MNGDKVSSGPFDDEALQDGVHSLVMRAIANGVEPNEVAATLERKLAQLKGAIEDTDGPSGG